MPMPLSKSAELALTSPRPSYPSGQILGPFNSSNSILLTVFCPPSLASSNSARQLGCRFVSDAAKNLVPITTPSAPKANAAATPLPSVIPPDPTTITSPSPASTRASLTSGNTVTNPALLANPWPPASAPCTTNTSGFASLAILKASFTDPTCTQTILFGDASLARAAQVA